MSSMRLQKFQIIRLLSIVSIPFIISLASCSKSGKTAGQSGWQGSVVTTGDQTSTELAQSPSQPAAVLARAEKTWPYPDRSDLDKLDRVLAVLAPKTRAGMTLDSSGRAEFLTDLEQLLEEEKGFRKDDLSLFYLIDKKHSVAADYVPKDLVHLDKNDLFDINKNNLSLRPEAYEGLCDMSQAALKDGVRLLVSSTYRSYEYQKWLFQHWVDVDGLEEAERESARAGTSQHQLGVAVDFGSVSDDFADTKMGKWVYAHSEEYGWSLSFPKGYEDVTGFRWESWHFRYIGRTACDFQRKWFSDVQQFMIEFLDAWKNTD